MYIFSLLADHFNILNQYLNMSILNFCHLFLIGIYFSFLYVFKSHLISKKSVVFDFLMILSFVMMFFSKINNIIFLFDLGVLLLFFSMFKSNYLNKLFTKDIFVIIGGMCYSIYLLHYSIVHFSNLLLKSLNIVNYSIVTSISIITVIIFSSIFYLLVEKPFMNSKN